MGDVLRNAGKQELLQESSFAQMYFRACTIGLTVCSIKGKPNEKHQRVNAQPHERFFFTLPPSKSETSSSSAQAWLKGLVTINKSGMERSSCWRRSLDTGKPVCSGSTVQTTVYVSLPVILILEITPTSKEPLPWIFEDKIVLRRKAAGDVEVAYSLVGRIFHSTAAEHYITRFKNNGTASGNSRPHIFDYNDLSNGGYAVPLDGKGPLAGEDSQLGLPDGYKTQIIIYYMKGGTATQTAFTKHQLSRLQEIHSVSLSFLEISSLRHAEVSISGSDIVQLPDDRRPWISMQQKDKFREYVKGKSSLLSSNPLSNSDVAAESHLPELLSVDGATDNVGGPEDSTTTTALLDLTRSGSPFPVECRCGIEGDGRDMDDNLAFIECNECQTWSHVSCQRNGRGYRVDKKALFICDSCTILSSDQVVSAISGYVFLSCFPITTKVLLKKPLQTRS